MKESSKKQKILMCMSGGVDSSVAALLLKQQGYDVTGAYMKQWSDGKELSGVCSWKEDRRDALRVAAHLDIPLITLDFEKEYKAWVMEYMFAEYEAGRTPNPDVLCNKYIKFGAWLERARELEFDMIATGHYAKKVISLKSKVISLTQAKDEEKDQTYFLHQLNQEQLSHTLFPLGELTKDEVREIAKENNLPTANREESMGICFVGEVPMKEFLQQKIEKNPGNIVTSDGVVVGEHEGVSFYTIGQRHVGVKEFSEKGADSKPLYVVEKRPEANEVVVGYQDDPLLYTDTIQIGDMHWIGGHEPEFPLQCMVRMRHRQALQKSKVRGSGTSVSVEFEEPQKAVTPGQFAVLYKDGECLGGGVIL